MATNQFGMGQGAPYLRQPYGQPGPTQGMHVGGMTGDPISASGMRSSPYPGMGPNTQHTLNPAGQASNPMASPGFGGGRTMGFAGPHNYPEPTMRGFGGGSGGGPQQMPPPMNPMINALSGLLGPQSPIGLPFGDGTQPNYGPVPGNPTMALLNPPSMYNGPQAPGMQQANNGGYMQSPQYGQMIQAIMSMFGGGMR